MLLRITFLVLACLALLVASAEDYYKVCIAFTFNYSQLELPIAVSAVNSVRPATWD